MGMDIRELKINEENPRTLSEFMEGKLIESLLVFPKMLEFRPLVIGADDSVLGGNMRLFALKKILEMDEEHIEEYLSNQKKYREMSADKKSRLKEFWKKFKVNPVVPVRYAKDFSRDEEHEFLIKDNIHYGEDDAEIMKHNFDRESIMDYVGSVAWNLYSYDEKINDKGYDIKKKLPESFKCGYVACTLTNEEYELLLKVFSDYQKAHNGNTDGFLSYLLSPEQL